jgi:hypothetical protein
MGHFATKDSVWSLKANKEEMRNAEEENPSLLEREVAFPSIQER